MEVFSLLLLVGVIVGVVVIEQQLSRTRQLAADKVEKDFVAKQTEALRKELTRLDTRCGTLEILLKNETMAVGRLETRLASMETACKARGISLED